MDPQSQQPNNNDPNRLNNSANSTPQPMPGEQFGVKGGQNYSSSLGGFTPISQVVQPQPDTGTPGSTTIQEGSISRRKSSGFLRLGPIAFGLFVLLLLGVLVSLYLLFADKNDQSLNTPDSIARDFAVAQIPLAGLIKDGQISIDSTQQLSINGQLRANNSFVIAPTIEPQNPTSGQIYYSQASNELFYYDGTNFVSLATNQSISNLGLGGLSGLDSVGEGLGIQGQTLLNTGVLSVQGQSGAVTLTSGGGIGINGLTISNTGVTGVSGTANQISVSSASGSVTLSLPQNISSTSTPTFAGLNLNSPLAVGSGGTGVTAFSANSVIVSNGSGGLTATGSGVAGQCLRSNGAGVAPSFQACPGGGGSGDVTAGTPQTAGSVVKWDAVSNQIVDSIISESAGIITVSGGLTVTGTISGNGSGITNLAAGNIATGTLADARLSANVALLNAANNFSGINTFSNASNSFTGFGSGLTGLNATNIASGTLSDLRLSTNVTVQGNSFNAASQLVQLNASTQLPAVSGTNLTNLNASSVSSGTLTVSFGGTGANSFAANGVLFGNNTGALLATAAGSSGQCLMAGALGVPGFQACPVGGNISSGASQTAGALTKFDTTTNQITDSILTEATGTVTASGNFTITGTPTLSALGAGILHSSAGGVITSSAINLNSADVTGILPVANGGTGSNTAAGARTNLGAAASGANSDITSLSGLTTALSVGQGGTGQTSYTDGQLLIGNTATGGLNKAVLTAGSGVTITNGNGSITIAAPTAGSCATCANVTLSNLSSPTAINQSLLTDGSATIDLGSATNAFRDLYLNNQISILESGLTPSFRGNLAVADLSASQTYTLNQGGTVVTSGNIGSYATTGVTAASGLTGGGTVGALSLSVGAGTGITVNADDIAVIYGAVAGSAVQGNTQMTVTAGTNLSGGGTVTLGSGGSVTVNTVNNPTFSTSVATPMLVLTGAGFNGTLQAATLGQATTFTLPDPAAATATICLSTGNCAGSGGGITGSGTAGAIAKFTGSGTIGNSLLSESGSAVTVSGTLAVTGASTVTLGTGSTNSGALIFNNATNANTLTLQSGATGSNLTFTLPTADGVSGQCLKTNSSGVLSFGDCLSGSGAGGGVTSLNGLSGAVSLANASGAGSTVTIDNASTTAKGIAQFNATNFTAASGTINTIQDISTTSSPTFATLTANTELRILEDGLTPSFYGTLNVADLSASQTYTLNEGGTVVTSGNVASHATTGVTAGSGLTGGGTTGVLTVNIGAGNGITVNPNDITLNLQANKGLEVDVNGLSLIDCADTEVLKYSTATNQWGCAPDAGGSGVGDDVSVNGSAATGANFLNVAATGIVTGTSWSLNTVSNPDDITLTISNASATEAGAVTTGTQTFAGAKTFNGAITAGAGIDLAAQTLSGTTAVINFTNFDVSSAGALTAVGVDAGTGLLQNTGGLTTTGTASINTTGIAASSIGNATGTLTLTGNSSSTIVLNGTTLTAAELNILDGGLDLSTETTGNYVATITAGAGLTGDATGHGSAPSLAVASANGGIVVNPNDIALTLQSAADALSATVSSGSGLEVLTGGLTLLQGCGDGQVLKWNETSDIWACAADGTGTASNSFSTINAPAGTDPVAGSSTDTLNLTATGTNFTVTGNSATKTIDFDIAESALAGNGITVSGDALQVSVANGIEIVSDAVQVNQNFGFGWTAQQSWTPAAIAQTGAVADFNLTLADDLDADIVSAVNIDVTSALTGDADILYGLNIGNLIGADATVLERAIRVGANWDEIFDINGTLISAAEFNVLDGGLDLSTETTGNYVATITAGAGLTGDATGHGSAPTLAIGAGNGIQVNADDIAVDATTTGTTAVTSSNSGLEATAAGLRLLGGCSGSQILKWNSGTSAWECAADDNGNSTMTLQQAYNNSASPEIVVDGTRGALTVRDNATPIGANLLELQNNTGSSTYFGVSATSTKVQMDSTTAFQVQNAAASSLLNVDTSTTSNLVTNGDLEGPTATGWTAKGASTLTQSTAHQWQGNKSLSVATTTAAGDGASYAYTFTPSTQYTLSLYAKVASGSITDVNIGRQDVSGTDIDCLAAQTVTANWTRFTCSFTTGATITSSNLYIKKTGIVAETFFIDGIQLQTGASATAFDPGGKLQLSGAINSPVTFQNKQDSTTAFQIQNAAGTSNLFVADTTNTRIGIGTAAPSVTLHVVGATTLEGGIINLNTSSNFATNINTGTSTGAVAIGNSATSGFTLESGTGTTNLFNGATAHTIQLATGAAAQSITMGSTNTTSSVTIQGGTGGINLLPSGASNTGVVITPGANSTAALNVTDGSGVSQLKVDNTNGVGISLGNLTPTAILDVQGSLRVRDANGLTSFTTPLGTVLDTKVAVDAGSYGNFKQLLSLGLTAASGANARGISMFDARTVAHQPSIGVFNPAEGDILGLSWDGSNTTGYLKTLTGNVGIRSGSTDIATFLNNGNTSLAGDLEVVGADITTTSTGTATLFNTNAVTLNIGGAATSAGGGINLAGGSGSTGCSIDGSTGNFTCTATASVGSLQQAYNGGSSVLQTAANDGIIFQNPASGGIDLAGAAALKIDQLATGNVEGLRVESAGTGNLLTVRDTTATARDVLTIADGGATTFRNQTDSATAFQIQNAAGTSIFNVDTTNQRLAVGPAAVPANGNLTVGVNTTTASGGIWFGTDTNLYRSAANTLTTDDGFLIQTTSGDAFTVNNAGGFLTFNVDTNVDSVYAKNLTAEGGGTATSLLVNQNGTGSILEVKDSNVTVASIADGGAATFKNLVNSTSGFQVQNAAGASLFTTDTANSNITILGNNSGIVQAWQTGNNTGFSARDAHTVATANGYIYIIGGVDNVGATQATVQYAKILANGNVGSWSTTTALPGARSHGSAVAANGYIYVTGGSTANDNASATDTVFYAKLNQDGTLGTWTTSANSINVSGSQKRWQHTSVAANGYLYVITGIDEGGNNRNSVYYAKLNADGSTGTWASANTGADPTSGGGHSSVVANGYVYRLGGAYGLGVLAEYAKINSGGTLGAWSSTTALPQERVYAGIGVANGYIYSYGGQNLAGTTYRASTYFAPLNADGTIGTWSCQGSAGDCTGTTPVNSTALPATRAGFGEVAAMANGRFYVIGGWNGSTASTVYYTSTSRVSLSGTLDLVGLSGENLNEGSTGGELVAGDTRVIGKLEVRDSAVFGGSVGVQGSLTVNDSALFKNSNNSTSSFQIQNAAGSSNLLVADTTNTKIGIGMAPVSTGSMLQVAGAIESTSGNILGSSLIAANNFTASSSSLSQGQFRKCVEIGTGGVSDNNVVILADDAGTTKVTRTTTARDNRVYGVAMTTCTGGTAASVAFAGMAQVTATTGAVAIGDQLVTSTTSGQVSVDNNATTGILGTALTAKTAGASGLVSVNIRTVNGQYSPTFRSTTDSTTAFQVQNAAGTNLFNVDSSNNRIYVGSSTADATGVVLVLDTKNTAGDPTGVDGAMYYNSSMGRMRCYFDGGWRFCNDPVGLTWGFNMEEDFLNFDGARFGSYHWQSSVLGTGANWNFVEQDVKTRPGQIQLDTGTTTTGYSAIWSGLTSGVGGFNGEPILIGGGEEIEFAINIPTLADATNDYDLRVGLCDNTSNIDCTDGVYVEYDRGSSANWRYATANNDARTKSSSSTAVATGWHRFKIVVNAAGNSIQFYVDGVSMGSPITTNIPSATGRGTQPAFVIVKQAGTTSRSIKIDYFQYRNSLTTPR